MAPSVMYRIAVILALTLALSSSAFAGIAWQGVNAGVVFIPPTNLPQSMPSFSFATPFNLIAANCNPICIWRIRNQNQPFFPVNQGWGLIQDTAQMLNTGPISTPAGVWGFWDPPNVININQTIRVFEVFTGGNPNQTSETLQYDNLISVTGYPGLTAASFPHGALNVQTAVPLGPHLTVLSDTIIGDLTGTAYGVTLIPTDFQSLQALVDSLNPNFAVNFSQFPPFVGQTGNIVLGYADIPAKDVILYNSEILPEPSSLVLMGTGIIALGSLLRRKLTNPGS